MNEEPTSIYQLSEENQETIKKYIKDLNQLNADRKYYIDENGQLWHYFLKDGMYRRIEIIKYHNYFSSVMSMLRYDYELTLKRLV